MTGVLLVIVFLFCISYVQKAKVYTFSQITNSRNKKIKSVEDAYKENGDDIIEQYEHRSFKKYSGKEGNTAKRKICFLDENGKELFKITEVGNNHLIIVSMDQKEMMYQFMDKQEK